MVENHRFEPMLPMDTDFQKLIDRCLHYGVPEEAYFSDLVSSVSVFCGNAASLDDITQMTRRVLRELADHEWIEIAFLIEPGKEAEAQPPSPPIPFHKIPDVVMKQWKAIGYQLNLEPWDVMWYRATRKGREHFGYEF
jgi:hypothetical protein